MSDTPEHDVELTPPKVTPPVNPDKFIWKPGEFTTTHTDNQALEPDVIACGPDGSTHVYSDGSSTFFPGVGGPLVYRPPPEPLRGSLGLVREETEAQKLGDEPPDVTPPENPDKFITTELHWVDPPQP